MNKRIAALFVALAMGLFGAALAPGSARASWNACPDARFCMWENTSYWGLASFVNPVANVCYGSQSWVSSIRNRRAQVVRIYTSGNCTTGAFDVQPGQSFSPMPGQIGDNRMRSYKMLA